LEILGRELARAAREHSPVGVVLVDLDHFKTINDTRGHFAGDLALQEAARRMKSQIRQYDSIGRYGGEEFLIVLPGCDEPATIGHAERIRLAIHEHALELPDQPLRMSASFGSTCVVGGLESNGLTQERLIAVADEALYRAKNTGRNRVVYCTPDGSRPARLEVEANVTGVA
jgi:diguanylate cyclase (GGDEF)-like protein